MPTLRRERLLRRLGLLVLVVSCALGGAALAHLFVLPKFHEDDLEALRAMAVGASLAIPAALVYLTVPRLLDRYDPEPIRALLASFVYGALGACGLAAAVNASVADLAASRGGDGWMIATLLSAPLVEEVAKGLGVFGVFYFLRREFDGMIDGVVYASFVGIGFAAIENAIYYGAAESAGTLKESLVLRGLLTPWCHPVYTSMVGLGLGLAREGHRSWVRRSAPWLGLATAILLHAAWNRAAVLGPRAGRESLAVLQLPLWFAFVAAFLAVVMVLSVRRGAIVRAHLEDEVARKAITVTELELIGHPFGLLFARMLYGRQGAKFVRSAARLALSKWHASRAESLGAQTLSADFIAPLREEMRRAREAVVERASRAS
jgi:protease PrsW